MKGEPSGEAYGLNREALSLNLNWYTHQLSETLHGFRQSFQRISVTLPQVWSSPLPSTSLPIHYSLIIPPFDAATGSDVK
jgi:hypothetical protein